MKFNKIVEICIHSSNFGEMRSFYIHSLGLKLVSEEKGRHVIFKGRKKMLFDSENTINNSNSIF